MQGNQFLAGEEQPQGTGGPADQSVGGVPFELVQYQPSAAHILPEPLPACTDPLPWDKRAAQERQREEARKQQVEAMRKKKKTLVNTLTTAVVTVATAALDAGAAVVDDFKDTQLPGADRRFRRYFPGFPQEKLYGEYEAKMVLSPELVLFGRFYVTSSFFCFHAEQRNKYTLFMLALDLIVSIQKAVVSKPPAGTPPHFPPQFNIVPGGQFPPQPAGAPPVKYPKMDALVIYTKDGMQHMFYNFRHFEELYAVLDYQWRRPTREYLPKPEEQPQAQAVPQQQQQQQQQHQQHQHQHQHQQQQQGQPQLSKEQLEAQQLQIQQQMAQLQQMQAQIQQQQANLSRMQGGP